VRSILVGYSTPGGANAYIPLRELASITLDTGASYIYHESNERYIPVKFSVRGRDLGSTVADAEARIRGNVKLPQGYRIKWAGEFEELRLAQRRLEIVAPIAIGAILLLLYMLFNSLRDSLLTLVGIPFSAAGSQVQRPLATVVVGGMLLGPIMLLVVAPALQVMVLNWSVRTRGPARARPRESDDES